eukprot:4418459-Pyramimonas_sp.AAC.2
MFDKYHNTKQFQQLAACLATEFVGCRQEVVKSIYPASPDINDTTLTKRTTLYIHSYKLTKVYLLRGQSTYSATCSSYLPPPVTYQRCKLYVQGGATVLARPSSAWQHGPLKVSVHICTSGDDRGGAHDIGEAVDDLGARYAKRRGRQREAE